MTYRLVSDVIYFFGKLTTKTVPSNLSTPTHSVLSCFSCRITDINAVFRCFISNRGLTFAIDEAALIRKANFNKLSALQSRQNNVHSDT